MFCTKRIVFCHIHFRDASCGRRVRFNYEYIYIYIYIYIFDECMYIYIYIYMYIHMLYIQRSYVHSKSKRGLLPKICIYIYIQRSNLEMQKIWRESMLMVYNIFWVCRTHFLTEHISPHVKVSFACACTT